MSVAVQSRAMISGSRAVHAATDLLCVRGFCADGKTEVGPWLINQTRPCDAVVGPPHFDDVLDTADSAAEEILERMRADENTLMADVVLMHECRVLRIVQYACGDGVVVKPEIQAHF